MKTLPKRPYLLQAYYDWIVDSELTPYLVVNADYPETQVPEEFVKEGQIVLNISPSAVGHFLMNKEGIQFEARFQGVLRKIAIPTGAVIAIYSREEGDGILFEEEEFYQHEEVEPFEPPVPPESPTLSLLNGTSQRKKTESVENVTKKKTDIKNVHHLRIIE